VPPATAPATACAAAPSLLPGEDADAFAHLHAAVTHQWAPRDAHERRWVMELVTAMSRQDRLRGLELAALAAATDERLTTFARYGARIEKDMAKAQQALRTLRHRPGACIAETPECTPEPESSKAQQQECTNEFAARTSEPGPAAPRPALNRHQHRRLEALARLERAARRWAA
jgi:hypothetical protein